MEVEKESRDALFELQPYNPVPKTLVLLAFSVPLISCGPPATSHKNDSGRNLKSIPRPYTGKQIVVHWSAALTSSISSPSYLGFLSSKSSLLGLSLPCVLASSFSSCPLNCMKYWVCFYLPINHAFPFLSQTKASLSLRYRRSWLLYCTWAKLQNKQT